MADEAEKQPKWSEIGRSTTSLTTKKERKDVKVDDYYVVVGFEVNYPKAFVKGVVISGKYVPDFVMEGDSTVLIQDLSVDYGHAFFYIVKNGLVDLIFSFGPTGSGKISSWNPIKDGAKNARPGTPDYQIVEEVRAYKIPLTSKQGLQLIGNTASLRQKIINGSKKYTVYKNDTCAEEARDLLVSAGIGNPSGSGWIKRSQTINFPIVYAVNPYMWNYQFKISGKYSTAGPVSLSASVQLNPAALIGQTDPLF